MAYCTNFPATGWRKSVCNQVGSASRAPKLGERRAMVSRRSSLLATTCSTSAIKALRLLGNGRGMVAIVHSFSAREPQVQTQPWGGSAVIWYEVIDQQIGIIAEKYHLSRKPEDQMIQLGRNFSPTRMKTRLMEDRRTRLIVRH